MKSLNRKIVEALDKQCWKNKPYGNTIELFVNRAEYNTFISSFDAQYKGDCCYKYNGNYWILRLVETGEEPKFTIPVSQFVTIDPLYYAHIESEAEMLSYVERDIRMHFDDSIPINFKIPQEFINEYRRLRQ
jgi:hypothetical protein